VVSAFVADRVVWGYVEKLSPPLPFFAVKGFGVAGNSSVINVIVIVHHSTLVKTDPEKSSLKNRL